MELWQDGAGWAVYLGQLGRQAVEGGARMELGRGVLWGGGGGRVKVGRQSIYGSWAGRQ